MTNFKLSEANLSFKVLVSFFLFAVGIGYLFGLIHIYTDVGFSYTGIVSHYRGEGGTPSLPPELAFAKLIHVNHIHIFGISMLLMLIGSIFTFTELPELAKAIFVATPFVGMILDFSSFWGLAFVSPIFAAVAMVFGALMAFSFFLIIGRPLYEMWILPIWRRKWGANNVPWFLR